jgi:hypothetical protein
LEHDTNIDFAGANSIAHKLDFRAQKIAYLYGFNVLYYFFMRILRARAVSPAENITRTSILEANVSIGIGAEHSAPGLGDLLPGSALDGFIYLDDGADTGGIGIAKITLAAWYEHRFCSWTMIASLT